MHLVNKDTAVEECSGMGLYLEVACLILSFNNQNSCNPLIDRNKGNLFFKELISMSTSSSVSNYLYDSIAESINAVVGKAETFKTLTSASTNRTGINMLHLWQ